MGNTNWWPIAVSLIRAVTSRWWVVLHILRALYFRLIIIWFCSQKLKTWHKWQTLIRIMVTRSMLILATRRLSFCTIFKLKFSSCGGQIPTNVAEASNFGNYTEKCHKQGLFPTVASRPSIYCYNWTFNCFLAIFWLLEWKLMLAGVASYDRAELLLPSELLFANEEP